MALFRSRVDGNAVVITRRGGDWLAWVGELKFLCAVGGCVLFIAADILLLLSGEPIGWARLLFTVASTGAAVAMLIPELFPRGKLTIADETLQIMSGHILRTRRVGTFDCARVTELEYCEIKKKGWAVCFLYDGHPVVAADTIFREEDASHLIDLMTDVYNFHEKQRDESVNPSAAVRWSNIKPLQ